MMKLYYEDYKKLCDEKSKLLNPQEAIYQNWTLRTGHHYGSDDYSNFIADCLLVLQETLIESAKVDAENV